MEKETTNACSNCERLAAQLEVQRLQIEALQAAVAQLQEQLASARKDSSNSSKPPSSDIVKPPKPAPADGSKRKIGGQPGHQKHDRVLFPTEQITLAAEHTLDVCPCCAGPLRRNGTSAHVVQQVDVQQPPSTVEHHTSPEFWCGHCQRGFYAPMPPHIEMGGLVGANLTTLIAYLKGVCHASFSTVRRFLNDVAQVRISRGQLAEVISKVSEALRQPYDELLELLPEEDHVNVDETGHKDNGKLMWAWCFRAELYTLFEIDPHRSADVLMDVLGEEFDGALGCDCFSAYRRYMRECGVTVQFCLAHLIREVKFLCTLPDEPTRRYGERLREALRRLFGVIHRREGFSAGQFRRRLQEAREGVPYWAGHEVPASEAGRRVAARMSKYGEDYFTFITQPGIEPTNNVAEQAIRFCVIDRHITQGTRGEKGQRFCERIWSVIATCSQQGRSVWDYLGAAVRAYLQKEEAPSLLAVQ